MPRRRGLAPWSTGRSHAPRSKDCADVRSGGLTLTKARLQSRQLEQQPSHGGERTRRLPPAQLGGRSAPRSEE